MCDWDLAGKLNADPSLCPHRSIQMLSKWWNIDQDISCPGGANKIAGLVQSPMAIEVHPWHLAAQPVAAQHA